MTSLIHFTVLFFSSQICKLYTQHYPWIATPEHLTLRALLLFLGCLDTSVDYIQIVAKNAVRKKINSEVYVSTWKFIYLCNYRKNSTITLWRYPFCQFQKIHSECHQVWSWPYAWKYQTITFHHDWQWLTANTPHWIHKLPTPGVYI